MQLLKRLFGILLLIRSITVSAQNFDFQGTVYYTISGSTLTSSGITLSSFNFSSASPTHPLFNDGIFFPVNDFLGNNLWLKVNHLASDPNGNLVGHNVTATQGSPFSGTGFGGWWGFQYQFDIFSDVNLTGARLFELDSLYPTNIIVESIETLSQNEWVSLEIISTPQAFWSLEAINFTGSNPNSKPGFSAVNIPVDLNIPPTGFDTVFPVQSPNLYVVDYDGGGSYSEFRVVAWDVTQFLYGYEYNSGGGYQGMHISFGVPSSVGINHHAAIASHGMHYQASANAMVVTPGRFEGDMMYIYNAGGTLCARFSLNGNSPYYPLPELAGGLYRAIIINKSRSIHFPFIVNK